MRNRSAICPPGKFCLCILVCLALVEVAATLGVTPRGRTCQAAQSSVQSPPASVKKRDPAIAVSVESILQKMKAREDLALVDVRTQEDFERLNIPGSINIPLFALKAKTFLKSKSVVLIDEGYWCSRMEAECAELRRSGHKVWYLEGGLCAWSRKHAPLQGDMLAKEALDMVPSPVFFEERDYENWKVIAVSSSSQSAARSLFPRSVLVPVDSQSFSADLTNILVKYRADSSRSVLIVDEKGERYPKIEKLIKEKDFGNVFFLQGGMEGYQEFLNRQNAMREARKNPKKTVKKCASCP